MPFLSSTSFCAAHLFIKIVLPIISLRRSSSFRAVCFSGLPVIFPAFPMSHYFSQHCPHCRLSQRPVLSFHFTLYLLYCSHDLCLSLPVSSFSFSPLPSFCSSFWSLTYTNDTSLPIPLLSLSVNQPLIKYANNPCPFAFSPIKSCPSLYQ